MDFESTKVSRAKYVKGVQTASGRTVRLACFDENNKYTYTDNSRNQVKSTGHFCDYCNSHICKSIEGSDRIKNVRSQKKRQVLNDMHYNAKSWDYSIENDDF
jgi:hypothetical protein